MNIFKNVRYKSTEEKIEEALLSLLHICKYDDISIKELCYEAGINRSSFYAHYEDINDFMIKTEQKFSSEIATIFKFNDKITSDTFILLFKFLLSKKNFYKAYLSTSEQSFMERTDFINLIPKMKKSASACQYTGHECDYHLAFFGGGLKAISKMWLLSDCKETPEQMAKIIYDEYKNNTKHFV